jgi:hypothetical protein
VSIKNYVYDLNGIPTIKKISSLILDTVSESGLHTQNVSNVAEISGNTYFTSASINDDFSEYKVIYSDNILTNYVANTTGNAGLKNNTTKLTPIASVAGISTGNQFVINANNRIYLSLFDTDTGWLDAWKGNTGFTGMIWGNLVKACMNGWKLTTANTNVNNCEWTGMSSGTVKTGVTGLDFIILNIDIGYIPHKIVYGLTTPVTTQLNINPILSKVIKPVSLPYDNQFYAA